MTHRRRMAGLWLLAAGVLLTRSAPLSGGEPEKRIEATLRGFRKLPDDVRALQTREMALEIRRLAPGVGKVGLASSLANLATEGDFGRDTLQEVAVTLAEALREQPSTDARPYATLAQLVRYEHARVSLDAPPFAAAVAKLASDDRLRQEADFTLTDLRGKPWTLKRLRGKVVLVNFWATWCPPCRKEMPDLQALYDRFKRRGLIILAISDEEKGKVRRFAGQQHMNFPILLDPEQKVKRSFQVEGIPRSLVYDRAGKLVAQAIDMRTRGQLLEMLAQAGLR